MAGELTTYHHTGHDARPFRLPPGPQKDSPASPANNVVNGSSRPGPFGSPGSILRKTSTRATHSYNHQPAGRIPWKEEEGAEQRPRSWPYHPSGLKPRSRP